MPVGRYFRGLTTFDLLGNLIPGLVVLVAIAGFLPAPPFPDSVGEYALFAMVAFSIGTFVQYHASAGTGDRRSFEWTMESAERLDNLSMVVDEDSDDSADDTVEVGEGNDESTLCSQFRSILVGITHAYLDPIVWWQRSERGTTLDDAILTNRIWNHLIDTHEIPPDTEAMGVLYHLMSSKVDSVQSPSRAVRFQALRNFNRGMWIASWYMMVFLGLALVLDAVFESGDTIYGSVAYHQPAYFGYWTPLWNLVVLAALVVGGFWLLNESYEEDYIEYLFSDYAVAISKGNTNVTLENVPDIQIVNEIGNEGNESED